MKWFGDISLDGIANQIVGLWGAWGLSMIFVIIALIYFVRKADRLEKDLNNEKAARLQDTKDYSKASTQPLDEFTKFIRTLYDGWNDGRRG